MVVNNLRLLLIFTFSQSAFALKCYTCTGQWPDQKCFAPIISNTTPSQVCNKTSANLSIFFKSEHVNPNYWAEAMNSSEFECVSYTKTYSSRNITQVGRGCFPKTPSVNVCEALYLVQGEEAFKLTQCDTCDGDNCNTSSSMFQAYGSVYLILLIGHYFFRL